MAQLQQQWRSRSGSDLSWLAMLIESLERVSCADVRALPCDPSILNAFRDQLARPVPSRTRSNANTLN
jgi:hypothetical protein